MFRRPPSERETLLLGANFWVNRFSRRPEIQIQMVNLQGLRIDNWIPPLIVKCTISTIEFLRFLITQFPFYHGCKFCQPPHLSSRKAVIEQSLKYKHRLQMIYA